MPATPSHKPLRWLRLWRLIGLLLVAVVLYMSLSPPQETLQLEGTDKFGHFVAYFALVFWFGQIYARRLAMPVCLIFVAMGAVIELVQPLVGRDGELADMLANGTGALVAFILTLTPLARLLLNLESRILRR